MPACVIIWIRFTNKHHSRTMKTINLPKLARALLTLRYRSCNRFAVKVYLGDFQFIRNVYYEYGFFFTGVHDFQTALNACLTVRDWETLTTANF